MGAAAYANDLVCQHFHRQISSGFIMCEVEELVDHSNENVSNVSIAREPEEQHQMLDIFTHFLRGMANFLDKFGNLSLEFHQNVKAKGELIEQAITFQRTSSPSNPIKLNILDMILTIVIARSSASDKSLLIAQLKKMNETNGHDESTSKIKSRLIKVLLQLQVSLHIS